MTNQRIVFIDLETTSLDTARALPIQIAAIAVDRITLEAIEEFEVKIEFDPTEADESALERNAYDPGVWQKEALQRLRAMDRLTVFLNHYATWERTSAKGNRYTTCEIGGHNVAAYDAPILQRWYKEAGEFCPAATWATGPVDTMHWARTMEFALNLRWDDGFSLGALCRRFGITLEGEHDALNDIRANVELAKRLRGMVVPQPVAA